MGYKKEDLHWKLLKRIKIYNKFANNKNELLIDRHTLLTLKNIPLGVAVFIYFYQLNTDNAVLTKKLVVQ